jgi:nitrous oxidase accessory protein NosD
MRTLVILVGLFLASPARAATVSVATNGVDGPSCGATTSPCRNIGTAIALANPGDTVSVGPGYYTEGASIACGSETAMIAVDKPITLVSTQGATATVIHSGETGRNAVCVTSSDVVVGKKKKGFTIRTALGAYDQSGIVVLGANVRIEGNILTENQNNGILLDGAFGVVIGNLMTYNVTGIDVEKPNVLVTRNTIASIETGIRVGTDAGMTGTRIVGNVVVDNGYGIDAFYPDAVAEITANTIAANTYRGILLGSGTSSPTITSNNFFGNGGANNCGLDTGTSAIASNNFWGSVVGPGADPADDVCPEGSAVVGIPSIATKEFKVKGVGALP